jgi:hypothetical protein
VFIGVSSGWLSPAGHDVTPDDISAHMAEIEDLGDYTVPGEVWEELRDIGQALARRTAIREPRDA